MKKILCIESGSIGGGSAESLYNHIYALKDDFEFYALFVRKNKYSDKIEKLGVKVFYFEDTLLNIDFMKKNFLLLKIFNLLQKLTTKFIPFINIYIDIFFHRKIIQYVQSLIIKYNIDIVHTNNQPNRDFYAIYASSRLNKEIISHIRTENSFGFTKPKINFCNKHITKYLSYTKSTKKCWDNIGINTNQNFIIHNSLLEIEKLNISKNIEKYTLSIIGRIRPERGYLFILDVIAELKNKYPKIKLQIVGDYLGFEDYYKEIQNKIILLDLKEHIIFTGYSNEVNQLISNSHGLILPYNQETFGRIVLEAWQLRTPVLLSRKGTIEDIVTDNVNGKLFDYEDIQSCKKAIDDVFSNQELCDTLIENGYITFRDNFTLTTYRDNFLSILGNK